MKTHIVLNLRPGFFAFAGFVAACARAQLLVLLAMLLFAPTPALSQQLVDNIPASNATPGGAVSVGFTRDAAQGFGTGGHSDGYTVTSVDLVIPVVIGRPTPVYTVGIWSASNGLPNTSLGALNSPESNCRWRQHFYDLGNRSCSKYDLLRRGGRNHVGDGTCLANYHFSGREQATGARLDDFRLYTYKETQFLRPVGQYHFSRPDANLRRCQECHQHPACCLQLHTTTTNGGMRSIGNSTATSIARPPYSSRAWT